MKSAAKAEVSSMRLAVVQLMLRADADSERRALDEAVARTVARGAELVVPPDLDSRETSLDPGALGVLGRVAVLHGDAAIDPVEHERLAVDPPDCIVLAAGAESELQAEAVLELALALSISVAGLVLVCERSGAEPGGAGHGGSAIVVLGEVLAEALLNDDVIVADVPVPIPVPAPRAPMPALSPILAQRLAHHRGERASVEYPADLT